MAAFLVPKLIVGKIRPTLDLVNDAQQDGWLKLLPWLFVEQAAISTHHEVLRELFLHGTKLNIFVQNNSFLAQRNVQKREMMWEV